MSPCVLDVTIRSGELVVRYADGLVQKLERRGVLKRAKGGWYVLLSLKELPPYARKQITTVRASTRAMAMVMFNGPDDE
jgi:hypothetical protein